MPDTIHGVKVRHLRVIPDERCSFSFNLQVLDFVEHLTSRLREEDTNWSRPYPATALRGLEEEPWPEYSEEDFKEKWQ